MAETIKINKLEIATVDFDIVGTSPLIVHAWSEKAKREMLEKQMKKAAKTKHDTKVPVNDFINSIYWIGEKPNDGADDEEAFANFEASLVNAHFGFPIGGIKQSFIKGAYRSGMDVKQTELKGTMFLEGRTEHSTMELAEIVGSNPIMRADMVRVGGMSKTADIRHRAEFVSWRIPLRMKYNVNGKYSLEQLLNCVTAGGFAIGIGEWRPEKDGQFGMYELSV